MAEKTYIVKDTRLAIGDLRNRAQVDTAANESRVVVPIAEYEFYSEGDEVKLDEKRAESLVDAGSIEPKSSKSKSDSS